MLGGEAESSRGRREDRFPAGQPGRAGLAGDGKSEVALAHHRFAVLFLVEGRAAHHRYPKEGIVVGCLHQLVGLLGKKMGYRGAADFGIEGAYEALNSRDAEGLEYGGVRPGRGRGFGKIEPHAR